MNKFQNKYRIPSTRLQNWDYRWAGAYFITICTHNRKHDFGEIHNGKMEWSHIGIIADILWYEIPYHAQHVELGAFVVMPNRIRNGGRDVACNVSTTITRTIIRTIINRTPKTPLHFHHCPFLQICRYQTCPPFRFYQV